VSVRVAERSDRYDHLLRLADLFDRSGDELRAMAELGTEVLHDEAVADSAELSSSSFARAEEEIRTATTGTHGLLARSLELDADALVIRATVLTYQWIDELRQAAFESLGSIAGRAIGYLAPNVTLGGAIVTAGLIETDVLDRDGVARYLSELAEANPELLDHVVTGGGGLLDGLQLRSALTVGFGSDDAGRTTARGGLGALGVEVMRQDSSAALRDVAAGLLVSPRTTKQEVTVESPRVPTSLADLVATLESVGDRVLVHRTAPSRYVAYVGRPPAEPVSEDGPAVRLVAGALTAYAAELARTIAAAVHGDADAHVMLVGAGAGGGVAAELAAFERPLPFVVDQVVTAGSPAALVPRLPATVRMLALEDRADPVALLGSLVNAGDENRTTVVFDTAGSSSEGVYVSGARAADASPEMAAELRRLRGLGYLAAD
jgi:hypothetical protein